MTDPFPQRTEMADESMVRNLTAQAECIWPQESALLARYGLAGDLRILDAGCGTGEITTRLAAHHPAARVLGIDVLDSHLDLARERAQALGARVAFEHRSVYDTGLPEGAFDLTVCRHVLQSLPEPERVLAELVRITRPGGWLHLIAEDYDMLHFSGRTPDARDFWYEAAARYGEAKGCDLFIGRHIVPILASLGLRDITLDLVVVDTLRCPREAFARILTAWRDGYAAPIAEVTSFSPERAREYFDAMIADIRDPRTYAAWFVPVVGARVP